MKKIKYIILPFLVVCLAVTSCSDEFLDVAPTGSLGEAELSSAAGLEGALISSYAVLLGSRGSAGNDFYGGQSNWLWGSILGGDANKGTDPGDQSQVNEIQRYASQPNNGTVLQKYATSYEGIARANATLRLVGKAEAVSASLRARIEAEARFLRGLYYFELKKIYNNTPYVDETWDEVTLVSNTADLWPLIEADLKFAYDNLPAIMPDAGRANKWAAGALYGKALLYQAKYADAKTVFGQVIANGVTAKGEPYGLMENYAMAFRSTNDNSKESVFAAQASAGTGTINNANPDLVLNFPNGGGDPQRPGTCCGFFQPSFELANSFRTDGNGLPLLDGSYNSAANKLKTDMGLAATDPFTPDAGNLDPRIDHNIGRRGIPYLDWGPHPGNTWIRNQPHGGPFSPVKMTYYKAGIGTENDGSSWTPGYTAVNFAVIRFADVLLMAAECEIELNNLEAGRALINQIRTRAANSPVLDENGNPAANYNISNYSSFASQTMARNALRFERKLELAMEGHRKFDLERWGIAEAAINNYLSVDGPQLPLAPFLGATYKSNNDEYQPIPQSEIDLIGGDVLKQNPGY